MPKTIIPLAVSERILKRTKMRISDDARVEFARLIEETVADISAEAVAVAKSRGRRTVNADDIRAVRKRVG